MTKAELRAAAQMLRSIVERSSSGELTGSGGVKARLEGAAAALEELAKKRKAQRLKLPNPHRSSGLRKRNES